MISINRLIKISRPKFWLYTAGPFLLAAVPSMFSPSNALWWLALAFFWFLFPGNLLVYGLNDLADQDTDQHNHKKNDTDEARLRQSEQKTLLWALFIAFATGIPLFLTQQLSFIFWLAFLVTSWCYSLPPVRAKAWPFLDGMFNILYILPAGVALGMVNEVLPWPILLAGTFWAMAMHAISAIPDIEPDRRAGLTTTAVLLGRNGTLWYCLCCYLAGAASLSFFLTESISQLILPVVLLFAYSVITIILLWQKHLPIAKIYPYYPIINTIAGSILFFWILYWQF